MNNWKGVCSGFHVFEFILFVCDSLPIWICLILIGYEVSADLFSDLCLRVPGRSCWNVETNQGLNCGVVFCASYYFLSSNDADVTFIWWKLTSNDAGFSCIVKMKLELMYWYTWLVKLLIVLVTMGIFSAINYLFWGTIPMGELSAGRLYFVLDGLQFTN